MLDPTKPDRSFTKWALVGSRHVRGSTMPVFIARDGQMLIFDTRQEARDFNHLVYSDKHKVRKIQISVGLTK